MSANPSVPQQISRQDAIRAEALRSLAEAFEAAFSEPIAPAPAKAEHLAELLGALYVGPQVMGDMTLHYFREAVTGTTVAVWEGNLSAASLSESLKAARVRFGVEVAL